MARVKKATILGASGFIGSHLAKRLRAIGCDVDLPDRADPRVVDGAGTVFYCVGLTADFRTRPFATIDAHVGVLRDILERCGFEQLVYLSSTRVYARCDGADEEQPLGALPSCQDDLYNLSKMTGESLALASGRHCRVARLSNVVGPGMGSTNFIGSLVDEAKRTNAVRFDTAPLSRKDYLWIDDAVEGLIALADRGSASIYNLAGGNAISHQALAELLSNQGVAVSFSAAAATVAFPPICIDRLERDTGFRPKPVLPRLESWLRAELST
jgi:nucleoside-diphosphate-sugar epimerase